MHTLAELLSLAVIRDPRHLVHESERFNPGGDACWNRLPAFRPCPNAIAVAFEYVGKGFLRPEQVGETFGKADMVHARSQIKDQIISSACIIFQTAGYHLWPPAIGQS
jgi:hypothetical protein